MPVPGQGFIIIHIHQIWWLPSPAFGGWGGPNRGHECCDPRRSGAELQTLGPGLSPELLPAPAHPWGAVTSPCGFGCGLKLCKAELAQSLSRGLILLPSFAPPLTLPCRDSPALTTHSITPPGQGVPARQAAGDALGNEGVPVLLVSAVLHGILPHTGPIHGCRTEAQVGTG